MVDLEAIAVGVVEEGLVSGPDGAGPPHGDPGGGQRAADLVDVVDREGEVLPELGRDVADDQVHLVLAAHVEPRPVGAERRTRQPAKPEHTFVERQRTVEVGDVDRDVMEIPKHDTAP